MPDGDNFKSFPAHPVIDPVAYAIKVKPPHIRRTRLLYPRPNIRLFEKYVEGRTQIFANGPRSGRPILRPPFDDTFDLGGSAPRDMEFKGHC